MSHQTDLTLYHTGMFFLVMILPSPPPMKGTSVAPMASKFTIFFVDIGPFSLKGYHNQVSVVMGVLPQLKGQ